VQKRLLGLIGQGLCQVVGAAVRPVKDIEAEKPARFLFELAGHPAVLAGVAVDVKGRRVVEVNAERCRVAELGGDYRVKIGVDLALFRIGAQRSDAVAIRR
jgi:hypothetical protein